MKSMLLTGIRQMEMASVPDPEIVNENDVLIKMVSVGVCGSDVHYYSNGQIGSQVVKYPFVVGHEGAGVVEDIGKAVRKIRKGDRVAIEPAMPCWKCDQCLAGRQHTCRKLRFLGCPGQSPGCLCEYIVMPEESCFKIDDSLSFEEAALSEPLAIGVYAVQKSIPLRNAKIAILGVGPIGLSVMFAALNEGAKKIFVSDRLDYRLEFARRNGAAWIGNPDKTDIANEVSNEEPLLLDAVFECCGQQSAMNQAVDILKPGGKLMIVGIPPTLECWSFPVDKLRHKELCIQNIRRQVHCVQKALDLISSGKIDAKSMVTHRFSFAETKKAFDIVENYEDNVIKAMILN